MDTRTWKKYWRRAVWVTAWLRFVPFVRLVGLNGSMATGKVMQGSDIDFYIVLEEGHLYTGRLLVTGMVQLLGLRRHGRHIAGRVCLNRYAVNNFLDITEHNLYHARVFHNLLPLFAAPELYEAYCTNNAWMAQFGYPVQNNKVVYPPKGISRFAQHVFESLLLPFTSLENKLRSAQEKRVWADARSYSAGSTVVTSEREIRFHINKELYG